VETPNRSPWRELPERFGPWQTADERLTRWSANGTRGEVAGLRQADADAAGEPDWLVAVDSTFVQMHQHGGNAATAPALERSTADAARVGGMSRPRRCSSRPITRSAAPAVA
jgi:transposase